MREELIELFYEAEGLVNNDVPSVETTVDYLISKGVVIQKHGKWERVKGFKGFFTWEVQCSLCGTPQDQKSKYCPHCFAVMDGRTK